MDPNVVWQRILEAASTVAANHPKDQAVLDLAYDVHTLGEWFAKGGFAPNQLTTARPVRIG
jgi:hypothetical protein